MSARAAKDRAFAALILESAQRLYPDLVGVAVVVITRSGVGVQGGGKVDPGELAQLLHGYADRLKKEAGRSLIIVPGRN